MSPKAIARNMDRYRTLRRRESDAFFAENEALRLQIKREADTLARVTAAALRQSDYWAPQIRDSYLAGLEQN